MLTRVVTTANAVCRDRVWGRHLGHSFSTMTSDETTNRNTATAEDDPNKSALQDNLDKKGKNAYYFAHAHKATGPAWDGKEAPRLLAKESSSDLQQKTSSFDYTKSNITSYAFLDDGSKVKLYITLEGVGEMDESNISLDYTPTSLSLIISSYKAAASETEETRCLCFGKLTAPITKAAYSVKPDKIVVTLTKEDGEKEWHTINDKGSADHEVV